MSPDPDTPPPESPSPVEEPLLPLPAREAVRRLALKQLEAWTRARARLEDRSDPEALHDFRVALRRLRSLLRAFRSAVHDLAPPALRRRLRRFARATGESRDLEVQLLWLAEQLPALTTRQRTGARWVMARLERRQQEANARLAARVQKRFEPLVERLGEAMAPAPRGAGDDQAESLPAGDLVAKVLVEETGTLARQLGAIQSIGNEAEAHAARIAVKRLRYLIEPFHHELPGAPAAIERLKALQDILGDLHDSHRIAEELNAAFRDAAVEQAERSYEELLPWGEAKVLDAKGSHARGGVTALAERLRVRGEELFGRLKKEWLDGGGAASLNLELRALAEHAAQPMQPGIEIERKFLLSTLPPHALDCPSQEIEQGWLPGTALVERLRHVRSLDGEAWFRTVKSGAGIQRIEIEEAADKELFEALWPLTLGRRVLKRRYLVPEGNLTWEVDQFLDRELTLAELELPSVDTRVSIPEWLRDYVVRDVTDEPDYLNRRLAR